MSSSIHIDGSFILAERARQHYWSGVGELSIKTFHGGRALYDVGLGRYEVDDASYLVLNGRQPYTITIDADVPVESFCIFFEDGMAGDVYRSLTASDTYLLDEPEFHSARAISFFERTYRHDELLTPALRQLRDSIVTHRCEIEGIREALHGIMERLLQVHRGACREMESLKSVRPATREELYRRLVRARDYAAASLGERVTLNDMARVACLSPNHLLRTFRQLFHQSPHQFLTARRLERARTLLAEGSHSVTEIAVLVGFESLGSFSSLFRRHTGVSPDEYRRGKR